jgi:mediator of RNA polymerase II transcription subunit 12
MKMLALGRGIELKDVRLDAKAIIALAEPLSAVQCTGALAFLAKLESYRGTSGESTLQSAVLEAIKAGSEVWPQLLEGAGPDSIRGIYRWAKEQVLDHALRYGGHDVLDQDEVSRNLDILSVAYHSASKEDSYSILASLTEKVKAIHEQFFAHPVEMRDHLHNVLFSIRVLLHLSILYSPTPPPTNSDMMDRNRLQLVGAWCILLGNPYLQRHQDLCEYICDVLSLLADPLTEDGLSCLRFSLAKKGYTDPRTTAVLGVNHSPDTWLALVSHPNVQGQGARAMLQKQAAAGGQQRQQAAAVAMQQQQQQQQNQNLAARNPVKGPMGMNAATPGFAPASEVKVVPYPLRRWEIMSNATPTVGDNDTSLSLTLFGARKV